MKLTVFLILLLLILHSALSTDNIFSTKKQYNIALFGGLFETEDGNESLIAYQDDHISAPFNYRQLKVSGSVYCIAQYRGKSPDDPHYVYIGGTFTEINGVKGFQNIARYHVQRGEWSNMNGGLVSRVVRPLEDLIVKSIMVDPSNGDVYVGGIFHEATRENTKIVVEKVALWNSTIEQWQALGYGLQGVDGSENHMVNTMALIPNFETADLDLYVGGVFAKSNLETLNNVARWDGHKWNHMDSGITGMVYSMQPLPGGSLVVCGQFTKQVGSEVIRNLALWNTANGKWRQLGVNVSSCTHVAVYRTLVFAIVDGKPCSLDLRYGTTQPWTLVGNTTEWLTAFKLEVYGDELYAMYSLSFDSFPLCAKLKISEDISELATWEPFGLHLLKVKEGISPDMVYVYDMEFVQLDDTTISFSLTITIIVAICGVGIGFAVGSIGMSVICLFYSHKDRRKLYREIEDVREAQQQDREEF